MGRSGGEGSCAPYGPQRAGPRERVRYGYRGVIVGEASHPGPVPAPADHSGVASTGEVRRYMRPTAGGGLAPRGGVATARAGVANPLGLVDVLGLLLGHAPIRWPWIRLRRTTTTGLRERPPDLGGPCPRIWTPVRRWPTPLWAGSPHRPLASLVIDRLIALARSPGKVLLTGGSPGPRTSRCLLLASPMTLAILSGVVGRTTRPCRPLIRVLPPRPPWTMFP